ncbi:bifunctional aminoglycoside phosphotransferase/ATP-binding protein [Gordonia sp. NPDC003425]
MTSQDEPTEELLARVGVLDASAPSRRITTHGAVIILNGDRAWKFKRPVRLRYFDFSTPQRRRAALDAEFRLNRDFAPGLYLGVHTIRRAKDGSLSFDGPGEVIEHVLEMKRFADDALLVGRAHPGGLDDRLLERLTTRIVESHGSAPASADPNGAARLQDVVDGNLASMSAFPDIIEPAAAQRLTDRISELVSRHADLLDARARSGRVRRCHGDLHLGNIAIIDGEPTPFDCLEFDDEMATTDVLYDLAFLVMDLVARDLRHEANVVANAYFDSAATDEDAFCLMPVLLSVRATVRAHVAAAARDREGAHHYLDLALKFTEPVPAQLIAIGGGSGTGKSTLARAIGHAVGAAPGARILRSDVLRKRMAGVGMTEPLPRSAYTAENRGGVYRELDRLAAVDLASGVSVIADAVFGSADQRDGVSRAACDTGCPMLGVWLELSESERISRIEARGPDASDADAAVARRQTQTLDVPAGWMHVPADDRAASTVLAGAASSGVRPSA